MDEKAGQYEKEKAEAQDLKEEPVEEVRRARARETSIFRDEWEKLPSLRRIILFIMHFVAAGILSKLFNLGVIDRFEFSMSLVVVSAFFVYLYVLRVKE